MARFVAFRLLQSLIALALLSVVVFILARATGDPLHMILPMNASEEDYADARKYLGLDRPYVEQYLSFVGRAVTGDFGNSIRARRPVIELLRERLPSSPRSRWRCRSPSRSRSGCWPPYAKAPAWTARRKSSPSSGSRCRPSGSP